MGEKTGIKWTDHTFNSHMGCQRVSPACGGAKGVGGCYAEALVTGRMGYNATSADPRRRLTLWGPPSTSTRVRTSAGNWRNPLAWDAAAKRDGVRRRVFCASLADVFEDHPDLPAVRADLWPLVEKCDGLDWQLLTKRPGNVRAMVPPAWLAPGGWPAHVWVGTTVEDQKRADERIPELLKVPAKVRFLSMEPLLEEVDLTAAFNVNDRHGEPSGPRCNPDGSPAVSWVIVGGESGPGARTFDMQWARVIVAQCKAAGVPVFVKQMGANAVDSKHVDVMAPGGKRVAFRRDAGDPTLDEARRLGRELRPMACDLRAPKGDDPAEWPNGLRVQEFPRELRSRGTRPGP